MLDELAVRQLGVRVPQLGLGAPADRPAPRAGLLERPTGAEQKPNPGLASLHGDLIARIEQYERAISGVLTHRWPRRPLPHALGQHAAWRRGVAERAASLAHVGEGMP